MQTWNVIATMHGADYAHARRLLGEFGELGEVRRTEFYNVLTMRVDDIPALLRRCTHGWQPTRTRWMRWRA